MGVWYVLCASRLNGGRRYCMLDRGGTASWDRCPDAMPAMPRDPTPHEHPSKATTCMPHSNPSMHCSHIHSPRFFAAPRSAQAPPPAAAPRPPWPPRLACGLPPRVPETRSLPCLGQRPLSCNSRAGDQEESMRHRRAGEQGSHNACRVACAIPVFAGGRHCSQLLHVFATVAVILQATRCRCGARGPMSTPVH